MKVKARPVINTVRPDPKVWPCARPGAAETRSKKGRRVSPGVSTMVPSRGGTVGEGDQEPVSRPERREHLFEFGKCHKPRGRAFGTAGPDGRRLYAVDADQLAASAGKIAGFPTLPQDAGCFGARDFVERRRRSSPFDQDVSIELERGAIHFRHARIEGAAKFVPVARGFRQPVAHLTSDHFRGLPTDGNRTEPLQLVVNPQRAASIVAAA